MIACSSTVGGGMEVNSGDFFAAQKPIVSLKKALKLTLCSLLWEDIIKLGQNSKSQIVTKLNKSNCDITQKVKLWQNSTEIVSKLKNSNFDKTPELK